MIRNILQFILIVFACIQCSQSASDFSKQGIDLSSDEWYINFKNKPEFSKQEFQHKKWQTISLPVNVRTINRSQSKRYWLRKTFNLEPENVTGNKALYLGRVYTSDKVYINGKLIGINGSSARKKTIKKYNFDRERIYRIPNNTLQIGENTIAIYIESSSLTNSGIVSYPIALTDYGKAYSFSFQKASDDLIFVGVYFFIGIFFLINYSKIGDLKEYFSFAIFIIAFAFYQFTRNEFRFFLFDSFSLYKFLEYFILLNIPYLYIFYLCHFLKLKRHKYLTYYGIVNALIAIAFFVFRNPVIWHNIVMFWSLHIIVLVGYSLYLSFQKMNETVKGSLIVFFQNLLRVTKGSYRGTLIFFISVLYFFYSVTKEIFVEMGILNLESSIDTAFLVFIFSSTIALRMRFIGLKINILKRYEQLKEVDNFRAKLFFYMDKIMSLSIKESIGIMQGLKAQTTDKSSLHKVKKDFTQIQQSMDDILELSRLEVTSEMLYIEQVNFVDYIQIVIPEGQITYTIKVDPRYEIENNLELINSLIIRLIDFSGFKDFENIDLIITNDLNNKIHFRFMLYHKNQAVTYKLYKELSEINKENIESIRWAIINETLRLLGGDIELGLLNKKYLRIDIQLDALPIPMEEEKPKVTKPSAAPQVALEGGGKMSLNDLKNLDVGEAFGKLVQKVKSKFSKK
ncbi:MAG: hypothetical protein AAF518_22855 [Spirochaetota bacterium]